MKTLKWFLAVVLLALMGCSSTHQGGTTNDYDTIHGSSDPMSPNYDPTRRDFPATGPTSGMPVY
jgi:hypothetical protein